MLVDGTPQPVPMLVDRERIFVQVPLVAASRMAPMQLACQQWAELAAPEPDGLITDLDAPLGEQLFDIAMAEREAVVQPHSVSDDLGWETVASERRDGRGAGGHEADPTAPRRLNLSMPAGGHH
jgi:hypothetical protein